MQQLAGKFTASDNDGREYTIFIYIDMVDAGTRGDPNAVIEGVKTLRTADGMSVNRVRKGEYHVVQTGVVLRTSSPGAP